MDTQRRSNLVVGLLLLAIGGWFLVVQYIPALAEQFRVELEWPLYVVGVGLLFFVLAAIARSPGLAVPGAIIAGIGGILYYQQLNDDFGSWAYAWALIPGFAGLGVILQGLFEGRFLKSLREGGGMIFSIFGAFLGGPRLLQDYWPVVLIVIGVWMIARGLLQPRSSPARENSMSSGDEAE
jgi:hypothetical protein